MVLKGLTAFEDKNQIGMFNEMFGKYSVRSLTSLIILNKTLECLNENWFYKSGMLK